MKYNLSRIMTRAWQRNGKIARGECCGPVKAKGSRMGVMCMITLIRQAQEKEFTV